MEEINATFITTETSILHELVSDAYEALMDGEKKEAVRILNSIAEKTREIKADLLTKEN